MLSRAKASSSTVTIGPGLLPVLDLGWRYTRRHLFKEIQSFKGMEKGLVFGSVTLCHPKINSNILELMFLVL